MKNRGVTLKIFCITGLLLITSAIIIYLTLYFLLPQFYFKYKEASLQDGVNRLIQQIEGQALAESERPISDFVQQHNARVILRAPHGYIIFFPEMIDRVIQPGFYRERFRTPWELLDRHLLIDEEQTGVISIAETVNFADTPIKYELIATATLQPIDEAAQVILMFLPYMLVVIIFISFIGAYIYSNILSKPLIQLNRVAKNMAQLDFTHHSTINTKDELGELSKSLNKLAHNLKQNMDELREANSQLKDDIQKEREQEAKRREFIATVSHELKTPITAVSGQLEGMIYNIGSYKDRDKYLKQSYKIMKQMEALVYEILEISQLESFDFEPKFTVINLSKLLNQTLDQFLYFSEIKNISFKVNITPDLFVKADEKLMNKALGNIMSNAVNYTNEGEQVIINLREAGEEILLQITNTGATIEETELEKIFEPFYRIDKSRNRKTGGSGLGLFIVQKVLTMHHVKFKISNTEYGVTFSIYFKKD